MKKVVITGGSKGIGKEIVSLFLKNDYYVVNVSRTIDPEQKNGRLTNFQFDLTEIKKIPSLVASIGEINILVNNAGILNTYSFDNYPEERKTELLKTNLEAPVALINEFSKLMMHKNERIINISSIAGHIGHTDIWYGISKAGIINLTKSYAKIFANKGIIVNCVAPGPVEDTIMFTKIPLSRRDQLLNSTIGHQFAKSLDVASVVYWLATEAPIYLNGVCIDLNNGAFLR